jgi:hypothetical protein
MAAIFAAIVMNTPAEAARPPLGATYTMMGTFEDIMRITMSFIDSTRPPGVFIWTMRASTLSFDARSIDLIKYSAVTGVMGASISITYIFFAGGTDSAAGGAGLLGVFASFVSAATVRTNVATRTGMRDKRNVDRIGKRMGCLTG